MQKSFLHARVIFVCLQILFFGTAVANTLEEARRMAQKDYQSAIAKIASVTEADMLECGMRHGPTAKACEIQAHAKRAAAEEQAKLARELASTEAPSSDEERKTAAKRAARVAKISYGMDKAKIAKEDKQAHAQCNEVKGKERNLCNSEVASRTAEANRTAKSNYDRSMRKAEEIDARK